MRHEVEFIIVGGVAAVLQRVPVATFDFDLVHARSPENVHRLLSALDELNAFYRDDPRRLRPTESHLVGKGHQLLESGSLRFDILGEIDHDGGYDDLVADTDLFEIEGLAVRVLTLEKLIEHKRKLGRPKDKLMLLHLEATLDERRKLEHD